MIALNKTRFFMLIFLLSLDRNCLLFSTNILNKVLRRTGVPNILAGSIIVFFMCIIFFGISKNYHNASVQTEKYYPKQMPLPTAVLPISPAWSLEVLSFRISPRWRTKYLKTSAATTQRNWSMKLLPWQKKMVKEDPSIRTFLLECTLYPPISYALQLAVRLPVFDFITMIDWVESAVVHKPFFGYI